MKITSLVAPRSRRPLAFEPAAPAPRPAVRARSASEVIDTSSPEAFRHTVVKWVAYVQDARGRVAVAKGRLAEARAAERRAASELDAPVVEARKALAAVEAPLQAELDRRTRALVDARVALDDALYPEKARALALEQQAAQLQRELDGHEASIRTLRAAIERLDPGSSWYRAETSRLNGEIQGHQTAIDRLSRRRFGLIQQANDMRAVQRRPDDPVVVAARGRVAAATEAVAEAQAALRDGVAPYVDRVDQAQQAFNRAMAATRANVADAERAVELAAAEAGRVEEAMRRVPGRVGFFKHWKWKLFDHFDAKAYWRTQAAAAGL